MSSNGGGIRGFSLASFPLAGNSNSLFQFFIEKKFLVLYMLYIYICIYTYIYTYIYIHICT